MVRRNESWGAESWGAEFWVAEFWGAAGCCARAGATRSQKAKTKLLSRTNCVKGDIGFIPLGGRAIACKRPPRIRENNDGARAVASAISQFWIVVPSITTIQGSNFSE